MTLKGTPSDSFSEIEFGLSHSQCQEQFTMQ